MSSSGEKKPPVDGEPEEVANQGNDVFDAVQAAAELDASLGDNPAAGEGDGAAYTAILEKEIEELSALIAEKERVAVEAEGRADRAQAEVTTASFRLRKEAAQKSQQATQKVLCEFIEVLDDLERAIEAARDMDHNPAVLDGIELVKRRFLAKLGEFGVTHRPSVGEPFDPNWHDAIGTTAVDDGSQNGTVMHVAQEGYVLGDLSLRPARVIVGKEE